VRGNGTSCSSGTRRNSGYSPELRQCFDDGKQAIGRAGILRQLLAHRHPAPVAGTEENTVRWRRVAVSR